MYELWFVDQDGESFCLAESPIAQPMFDKFEEIVKDPSELCPLEVTVKHVLKEHKFT